MAGSILSPAYGPGGAAMALQPRLFDNMIARLGARVSWMKGHSCPCTFGGGGANGYLPLPGSAASGCKTCLGLGTYWDAPSMPFIAFMKFTEIASTPFEPGVKVDTNYGDVQTGEPSMTIPFMNWNLSPDDPQQPTQAWIGASTDDIMVAPDMLSRFTAKLQVGGITYLPYQQNLQIAPKGAVTIWNPTTMEIESVPNYVVNNAEVTIDPTVYPPGTAYMVEFSSAPMYVLFRPAGGIPHVRPVGGGTQHEPRRFKIQTLDFWTRQRAQGQQAAGSVTVMGQSFPQIFATGSLFKTT